MSENFNKSLLKLSVAQICLSMGWHSLQRSTHAILTDLLERYMRKLSKTAVSYSENYARTMPSLEDIGLAFDEIGIPLDELKDYVTQVEAVPFPKRLAPYPVQKAPPPLASDAPTTEELLTRPDYYDEHLPSLSHAMAEPKEAVDMMEVDVPTPSSVPEVNTAGPSDAVLSPVQQLKVPLARKRSVNSPPYSPVEPKRPNLDWEHYNADLTRPDLKVSTPKGLAPITTVAEITSYAHITPTSSDGPIRDQPHADKLSPMMQKAGSKPQKSKGFSGLLSPTKRAKHKSPDKATGQSILKSRASVHVPDIGRRIEKGSLTLDLPEIASVVPTKTSPKPPKPTESQLLSPIAKKLSSPVKVQLKKSPSKSPVKPVGVSPHRAITATAITFSSHKDAKQDSNSGDGHVATGAAATLPKHSPKSPAGRSAANPISSPEPKQKSTFKTTELLSPSEGQKKSKDNKHIVKAKKKKSARSAPAQNISNLLFSDPLISVSSTHKKPSPGDTGDSSKSQFSVFKSPSSIKSPPPKVEKKSVTGTSTSVKKKKKKVKEKDHASPHTSAKTSSSQSEKKAKKEKSKEGLEKAIPKLTLKMGPTSSDTAPPKLIIKTASSPPSTKTTKSQVPLVVAQAPTLATGAKTETPDDAFSRGVFTETLRTTLNPVTTTDLYYCPACNLPDNGSPMIGCDICDQWFHWPCVSVVVAPKDDESWFCPSCAVKQGKKKKKKKRKDD